VGESEAKLKLLMLRTTPLRPKRADSRNIRVEALFLRIVGLGRQLNKRVQGHFHPGTLLLRDVHVVSVDAAQDGLVRDDDDVLAALEFHDDGFEPDDDVAVTLAASVAVVVFVVVTGPEVFGESVFDFLVGEAVADAGIEFVERFPFELVVAFWRLREEARRLDGAFEGRGPDGKFAAFGGGLRY